MEQTFKVTFYVDRSQPQGNQVYCTILGDVDLEKIVVDATSLEHAKQLIEEEVNQV